MIEIERHGPLAYKIAWQRQLEIHEQVKNGLSDGVIMALEHQPCITLGRHAQDQFLLVDETSLAAEGIELIHTDRGGEVTAHNPGQVVIYPILPVKRYGLSPKKLVAILLNAAVSCLKVYGIESHIDDDRPGVWVGSQKICAVGIRIRDRVSLHGIALNVSNDLGIFRKIVPCGISQGSVTRLQDLVDPCPQITEIREQVLLQISQDLELNNPSTRS